MAHQQQSPLAQRLGFYGINPMDDDFAALAKGMDKMGPEALGRFYDNVAATPETNAFFADRTAMDRARTAQTRHWRRIFEHGVTEFMPMRRAISGMCTPASGWSRRGILVPMRRFWSV